MRRGAVPVFTFSYIFEFPTYRPHVAKQVQRLQHLRETEQTLDHFAFTEDNTDEKGKVHDTPISHSSTGSFIGRSISELLTIEEPNASVP